MKHHKNIITLLAVLATSQATHTSEQPPSGKARLEMEYTRQAMNWINEQEKSTLQKSPTNSTIESIINIMTSNEITIPFLMAFSVVTLNNALTSKKTASKPSMGADHIYSTEKIKI